MSVSPRQFCIDVASGVTAGGVSGGMSVTAVVENAASGVATGGGINVTSGVATGGVNTVPDAPIAW